MPRARRASGGREGELLDRASHLRKGVDGLLPKLTPECPKDRFERLRGALEEVREDRDDRDRLLRRSRAWGGEDLAKAYAGLLAFYLEPELPALLVAPFPGGDISYAPLSKAPKEAEVAVQQSADPRRLLLGYLPIARKGMHFFAAPHQLYATGDSPKPPGEFRDAKLKNLPYRLTSGNDDRRWGCAHLQGGAGAGLTLAVGWPGAGLTLRVCRRCAKSDRHLLGHLTEGAAVPDVEEEFPVSVELGVQCRGGPRCFHAQVPPPSKRLHQLYVFGRVGDGELLETYRKEIEPLAGRISPPIWVAGGICYGTDRAAFVRALGPTPEETRALDEVLPEVSGMFEIEEATASRALEKLWPSFADQIVRAIVPDETRADALVREARANPGRVSELLGRAARETREREILGALPVYRELPSEARFIDGAGRAYRTGGAPGAERTILATLPREGKERGLAWGLLTALARAEPHRWQFSETERQFGEALAPLAHEYLEAPPGEYHQRLGRLLGSAGVAGWPESPSP